MGKPFRVLFAATLFAFGMFGVAHAGSLTLVSDVISTSAPATSTVSHTIEFTLANAIPASGRIVIYPEGGAFTIPSGFDHADVDLAVSNGGPFADRTLAATANGTDDGVAITSGNGPITITLNSSSGIAASSIIQIQLGTIATADIAGDTTLTNPTLQASYRIALETHDASNVPLDAGKAMIAIVAPVTGSGVITESAPIRSNGLPSGLIEANHSIIEISLNTNEPSTCSYATSTGIQYESMTGHFTTGASSTVFHTTLSGHVNDTTYNYYVRCIDDEGAVNDDDYAITFTLKPTPEFDTSVSQPDLGPGGVGPFPNGSNVLYLANVVIAGQSSPQSTVAVLKDGRQIASSQANGSGVFQVAVNGLERGTYSFMAFATDRQRRVSSGYSSTLSLVPGTNNRITNVVLPPTIELGTAIAGLSEEVRIFGESIPGATVEVMVGSTRKLTATTTRGLPNTQDGLWEVSLNTAQLSRGTYIVRARTLSSLGDSGYSKALSLGVGEEPSGDLAARSDINGDGKVNLVDFSIMLTHWNTDEPSADINEDGAVNLADFSILLFNWTG